MLIPSILLASIALASGVSSPDAPPPVELTEICAHAVEVLVQDGLTGQQRWELYVGRMELRMGELALSEENKKVGRIICQAYVSGALKGMDLVVDRIEQSTVAARPKVQ